VLFAREVPALMTRNSGVGTESRRTMRCPVFRLPCLKIMSRRRPFSWVISSTIVVASDPSGVQPLHDVIERQAVVADCGGRHLL
jgi:hypothetical protein